MRGCIETQLTALVCFSSGPVARIANTAEQDCHRVVVPSVVAGVAVGDAGTIGCLLQQRSAPVGTGSSRGKAAQKCTQQQMAAHLRRW